MDLFDVFTMRHSIRAFEEREIENEKIQKILNLTNLAPSAGNLQGYEIFLVTGDIQRNQLVNAANGQNFLGEAPIIMIFCANPGRSAGRYNERGQNLYCIQDATIACTYAMLASTALGLASVWVGAFDDRQVMEIVGIPADLRPVVMLPIGYPGMPARITSRRSLDDLVHHAG
jgi:nitroreductase